MQPPRILLTGSMRSMGEQHGFIAFEYSMTMRNTGQSTVHVIAFAFTATGIRFSKGSPPTTTTLFKGAEQLYQRDARVASRAPVYRFVELTRFVDPKYGGGHDITPDEAIPFSGTFLVRKRDFDEIVLDASVGYTKGTGHMYPTRVHINPLGVALIEPENSRGESDYIPIQVTLAHSMLCQDCEAGRVM